MDINDLREQLYELEEEIKRLKSKKKGKTNSKTYKKNRLKEEITILSEMIPRPRKLGHLARKIGFSGDEETAKKKVLRIIERLRRKGYKIVKERHEGTYYWERMFKKEFVPIDFKIAEKKKIAYISDSHIGNEKCREDLLKEQYEIAKKEKCELIIHSGDVFEGINAHPGHRNELKEKGADEQLDRALKIWPQSDIPTAFISGSAGHAYKSFWLNVGYDIVRALVKELKYKYGKNLYFYNEKDKIFATFKVGNIKIMSLHPTGGAPKSRSYRPQEIINKLFNEIVTGAAGDVHIIAIGHLHLAMFMMYKGIAIYLVPCIVEANNYLQSKTLIPDLGMWVSETGIDKEGNTIYIKNRYYAFNHTKDEIIKIK